MPHSPVRAEDRPLHDDVRLLAGTLGSVIHRLAGEEVFVAVESLRVDAKARRRGEADAPTLDALLARVDALSVDTAASVARAFSLFFLLINTAEQVHRERRRASYAAAPEAPAQVGSVGWLIEALRADGVPADQAAEQLGRLDVHPGLQKYFQNPMAVRVLRRAHCPVYVPRTDTFGERAPRLLVGIDLASDRLEFMVEQAQTWARVFGGKVDLMHAMERSFPPVLRPELRATAEEEWRRTHHKNLERLTAMTDWLPTTTRGIARLEHGEADAALVDASHDYDLLLMGSRDRDTIERMLLGSVAKFVIANAQCDLLFLPTAVVPDDAEDLKVPESIG